MEENDIKFFQIDYKTYNKGFVSNPHSHKHYEIFYFEKGNASHFIDFEEYPITDNSLFLVSYNQVHYITAKPDTHNLGYAISLEKEIFGLLGNELNNLFGKFSKSPAYYLKKNDLFTTLFQQIKIELEGKSQKSNELVFSFIKILLTYIWREERDIIKGKTLTDTPFLNFLHLIEDNFIKFKEVQEYAQMLSITTKQLNRICKKNTNQTALFIIHDRINLEAKRKLFYSENQIKDICYDLGFENTGHFNNFFKRMNEKTPLEFRIIMSRIFN
ncbi:hypothetical protein A5893_13025 [Pedobacter psychrophilus]|uniref:HTH araC/xylS-type domain-containing protein n=1 Tax=Pedobacter psychrophilus TaxID=1826909 RepID=A0A179DDH3_9SPHI|nr:helix-turn-helix transcriptional regulator [Pedobacter psychrophilus]OAQ38954.1 hypothetical protein A5893_13025 [Pedobacter psychrophilus]